MSLRSYRSCAETSALRGVAMPAHVMGLRALRCTSLMPTLLHRAASSMISASEVAALGSRTSARRSMACMAATGATSEAPGAEADRVVVVGGGFGGLYTAVRLESLFWPRGKKPQVTLVDQSDRFVFKPLLYDLLHGSASEAEVAPPYAQLLAPYPIRYIQARAESVLPDALLPDGGSASGGSVQLSDGSTIAYDWLVVALGSSSDAKGVPGVMDLAVPFNTYEDVLRTKEALDAITAQNRSTSSSVVSSSQSTSTIMVVGAGYAGVELASVVAESMKGLARVQLVTPGDKILDGSPPGQRAQAERILAQLGVEVLTGTKVLGLRPRTVAADVIFDASSGSSIGSFDYSPLNSTSVSVPTACMADIQLPGSVGGAAPTSVAADLVLWTAGSSPATKGQREGFPFPTTSKGAVETEATLRVKGFTRVFALGDISAAAPEAPPAAAGENSHASPPPASSSLPATAQVAFQQADYAAWNLWASINRRPLLPFRYQHLGSMMSLGQLNGAVALPIPVPLPLKSALTSSPLGPLLSAVGVDLSGTDSENGVTLEGPLAAVARRAAYLYRQPTNEQRVSVAVDWFQQAAGAVAALASSTAARQQQQQAAQQAAQQAVQQEQV